MDTLRIENNLIHRKHSILLSTDRWYFVTLVFFADIASFKCTRKKFQYYKTSLQKFTIEPRQIHQTLFYQSSSIFKPHLEVGIFASNGFPIFSFLKNPARFRSRGILRWNLTGKPTDALPDFRTIESTQFIIRETDRTCLSFSPFNQWRYQEKSLQSFTIRNTNIIDI